MTVRKNAASELDCALDIMAEQIGSLGTKAAEIVRKMDAKAVRKDASKPGTEVVSEIGFIWKIYKNSMGYCAYNIRTGQVSQPFSKQSDAEDFARWGGDFVQRMDAKLDAARGDAVTDYKGYTLVKDPRLGNGVGIIGRHGSTVIQAASGWSMKEAKLWVDLDSGGITPQQYQERGGRK